MLLRFSSSLNRVIFHLSRKSVEATRWLKIMTGFVQHGRNLPVGPDLKELCESTLSERSH